MLSNSHSQVNRRRTDTLSEHIDTKYKILSTHFIPLLWQTDGTNVRWWQIVWTAGGMRLLTVTTVRARLLSLNIAEQTTDCTWHPTKTQTLKRCNLKSQTQLASQICVPAKGANRGISGQIPVYIYHWACETGGQIRGAPTSSRSPQQQVIGDKLGLRLSPGKSEPNLSLAFERDLILSNKGRSLGIGDIVPELSVTEEKGFVTVMGESVSTTGESTNPEWKQLSEGREGRTDDTHH